MNSKCRYCGLPTTKPSTGRPPDYCTVGCRRAAEYDVRRISRRLESLERKRDELEVEEELQRREGDSVRPYARDRLQAEVHIVERQIARDRDRLCALLDNPDMQESAR